jgi:hypothetical protein
VQISWDCTPPYLSTGIPNLLQPAQAEVVLGQLSTYLASWDIIFSRVLQTADFHNIATDTVHTVHTVQKKDPDIHGGCQAACLYWFEPSIGVLLIIHIGQSSSDTGVSFPCFNSKEGQFQNWPIRNVNFGEKNTLMKTAGLLEAGQTIVIYLMKLATIYVYL